MANDYVLATAGTLTILLALIVTSYPASTSYVIRAEIIKPEIVQSEILTLAVHVPVPVAVKSVGIVTYIVDPLGSFIPDWNSTNRFAEVAFLVGGSTSISSITIVPVLNVRGKYTVRPVAASI